MPNRRLVAGLVIVGAVGIAWWTLVPRAQVPPPSPDVSPAPEVSAVPALPPTSPTSLTSLTSRVAPSPVEPSTSQAGRALTAAARAEVEACVGRSVPSLEALVTGAQAVVPRDALPPEVTSENLHVEQSGGRRVRLRIAPADSPEPGARLELRFYGEDAEGLPEPMALPDEYRGKSAEEIRAAFVASGRAVLVETASRTRSRDGAEELAVTRRDGEVVELELRKAGPGRVLRCALDARDAAIACRCAR